MAASFTETVVTQTVNLDLARVGGGGAKVRDLAALCTDLLLIVIRMREAEDLGQPAALRKLVLYYVDLFDRNCKAMTITDADRADARYALIALLDEAVLSSPGICRDFWITSPLQLELFGDSLAGQEFFRKLQQLLTQPEKRKEVLEVYYLCLSLGFEGKYKIANPQERQGIIEEVGRTLRRTRMRSSSGLSPHGDVRSLRTASAKRPFSIPLWLVAVVNGMVLIIVWCTLLVVNNMQSGVVDRAVQTFMVH